MTTDHNVTKTSIEELHESVLQVVSTEQGAAPTISHHHQYPPHTQDVFVEGAGEVDVHQLSVVQSQAQDLTCKPEEVQMVWVHGGVTVGLESGTCKKHRPSLCALKLQRRFVKEKGPVPSAD